MNLISVKHLTERLGVSVRQCWKLLSAGKLSEPVGDAGCWARRASALLATVADSDRRADLRELFEHRAGVAEFDGRLARDAAERIAYDELRDAMPSSQ